MNTKLLRNNLLVLLGYAVLIQLLSLSENNNDPSMVVAMGMMVAVAVHVCVLFVSALLSFRNGDRPLGWSKLLAALIVGMVGFGTCFAGAGLAEA